MAEYKMSYEELEQFVDEAISNTHGDRNKLQLHKAEIMTALTGVFSDEVIANQREQNRLIELWSNRQEEKSQRLIGRKHIRINDSMLALLEALLTGGMCDAIISAAMGAPLLTAVTIGAASSVIVAILQVFRKASELQNFDFCLYMQAITHYYEKWAFSMDDIISWYPDGGVCNMHTSKWCCSYVDSNDNCKVDRSIIERVIDSLEQKDILDHFYDENTKMYKIKG